MPETAEAQTVTSTTLFDDRFRFDPEKTLFIGVERECFLTRKGVIVPEAPKVLALLPQPRFSYELSACQLEERIGPCKDEAEFAVALRNDSALNGALSHYGLQALHCELAPYDMPLDVFPDPTGRYQRIVETLPKELLLAACRVAATHVQIGMPDKETAVRVHDAVVSELSRLCAMGDHSDGERLRMYGVMARDSEPKPFGSWDTYRDLAIEKGFASDPRQCWRLIRISVHGTIEFRMFGATSDLSEIEHWASTCRELCRKAL